MLLFLVVLSSFTSMNDCRWDGLLLKDNNKKHVQVSLASSNYLCTNPCHYVLFINSVCLSVVYTQITKD